ncbi:uncharacterized protein LOC105840729 isoform X2 [Monomorium pharaonis]|uniref:uncharacterized protein LOC105840729 isoform X2 n=1 Tax=Monomorium pharaonis TaxID=307658 RepID=UPI00063F540D|nr:uncharacterized protein LOC105840729 isoform X2 [Monomorium pharaonis]
MTKRQRSQTNLKFCYESPLNVFKKSLEDLTSVVRNIVFDDERLIHRKQKLNKQTAARTPRRFSRTSVIVISDSETNDGCNVNETNDRDEQNTSLSIIACGSKLTSPLQRQTRKSKCSASQRNTKASSRKQVDNDSSILSITQESSLDGENIAPSQTNEDDIVELWSCLKNVNKCKRKTKPNHDKRSSKFIIDTRPNLNYLKYLATDTKTVQKRKKQTLPHKTTVKPFEQKLLKNLNSGRRKRRRSDNDDDDDDNGADDLNSNLSNAHCSKKKIIQDEKNHKTNSKHKLREIIVDGCNVAMAQTNNKKFSEKGIELVVNYFKDRGHIVKVFLPKHLQRQKYSLLEQLHKEGIVIFTPSRKIAGRTITSYDDRFILEYATLCEGIVISSDQYRDLYKEKPEWRDTITNRLLIPTFVGNYVMFPEDPLGQFGPNLEIFLRH